MSDSEARGERRQPFARARERIDAIDDRLLELLGERAAHSAELDRLRQLAGDESGAPVSVPELELCERLERQNRSAFPTAAIRGVFREIFAATRPLPTGVRVAYLGPAGTYTHQAAFLQFGRRAVYAPALAIPEVFREVEAGRCAYGVVPIENSSEGALGETLDRLIDSELAICAEIYLAIRHDLLARPASLLDIRAVYAHPQGLAQCRQWLERHLPHASLHPARSIGHAAECAGREPGAAAIASPVTRELCELELLAAGIEDRKGDTTRFLVIGSEPLPRGDRDMTALLFCTRREEVGTLYRALEPFARAGVNLARIESRPTQVRAWEYLFFGDFEGSAADPALAQAIEGLRGRCEFLKILGSYPRIIA